MKSTPMSDESHASNHINWLRAAVLGANDGIVSTASLIVGVAAAHASHHTILLTGAAGLVAGAMSMATGEYVSVSSQADTERADLIKEKEEISHNPQDETRELAGIYQQRGLDEALAYKVATQLMAFDAIGSHARDELGITDLNTANPVQAAVASAFSFSIGAALPLALVIIPLALNLIWSVSVGSIVFLMVLGVLAAKIGGASMWQGALRVGVWGTLALAATAGIGHLIGTPV